MVFSTNQVRQLYVVSDAYKATKVTETDNTGTISIDSTKKDGEYIYFQYKGADNLMRSDLIKIDNILCAKYVKASDPSQKTPLKQVTVKLDPEINEGKPVKGQDYILRITINPYIGMSDEEPYYKYGMVCPTSADTKKFYTALAASLYQNFSKELDPMLEFSINGKVVARVTYDSSRNPVLLDKTGTTITVPDEYTDGIVIKEKTSNEWVRGIKSDVSVNFTVTPTNIEYDATEVPWGTVEEDTTGTTTSNSKKIADLEYFCMGERGDQYRMKGWPKYIPTKYLVDENKEGYNIFELHYSYTGPNEGPQKSEKDITIVAPTDVDITGLVTKFNELTGLEVSTE